MNRERTLRRLGEVEGYLLLDLPTRALELLQSRPDWTPYPFEAHFLTGEALRALGRFRDALPALERAAALRPGHPGVAVCLGWCYKRTHRLAQAIDALERALREHPDDALLHYNLACYWSLAGDADRSLGALRQALDRDPDLRALVEDEPDFDAVRESPGFAEVLAGRAPLA